MKNILALLTITWDIFEKEEEFILISLQLYIAMLLNNGALLQ